MTRRRRRSGNEDFGAKLALFRPKHPDEPDERYEQTFEFPELPPLQPDQAPHWAIRARHRKRWHRFVAELVLVQRARPTAPLRHARVICTRYSAVAPDADNLGYSFKPLVDGLVEAGVLADDSPDVLEQELRWSRAPFGAGRVTMTVTNHT